MLPGSRHRTAALSACCFFFFFDLALENASNERAMISRQVNKTSQRFLIFDCTVKLLSGKRIETCSARYVARANPSGFFPEGVFTDILTNQWPRGRERINYKKSIRRMQELSYVNNHVQSDVPEWQTALQNRER